MARFIYDNNYKQKKESSSQNNERGDYKVSFFNIKEDGEEAVVRFIYDSPAPENFHTVHVHALGANNKYRRISCLRGPHDPFSKCPFCASDDKELSKLHDKVYIKLLQYLPDEKSGKIVAHAKVWERHENFVDTLTDYFDNYGPLSEVVFKIKRRGKKGDTKTTYDIMYANPMIFKPEIYVQDFSAFDNLKIEKVFYLEKTAAEMQTFLNTGEFPAVVKQTSDSISGPVHVGGQTHIQGVTGPNAQTNFGVTQSANERALASVTAGEAVVAVSPEVQIARGFAEDAGQVDPSADRPKRHVY